VTAAVLTAQLVAIDRFATPDKLVSYFGIYPIEFASGVDRDGTLREPTRLVMSQRGNDLVRRYLWMAALTGIEKNPPRACVVPAPGGHTAGGPEGDRGGTVHSLDGYTCSSSATDSMCAVWGNMSIGWISRMR
jgi:hypothetical protein